MSWTLAHSIGMLLVVGAAWALGDARVFTACGATACGATACGATACGAKACAAAACAAAVFGAASLGVLVALRRGAWTPSGRFGAANFVTALRVLLIVGLATVPLLGPSASLTVVSVLALDGLDGLLARRLGAVSAFGATFDMETDALLVLVAALRLAQAGRLGAWIVLPGLYRYLYVVAISLAPAARGDAPRSRLGRTAFAVLVTSLAGSLWPVPGIHEPLALVATALVTLSFARSAWWSFARPTSVA